MILSLYTDLLKKYLRPEWVGMVLLALLLGGGIILQLAGPQVIRFFLDTAQSGAAGQALLYAALLYIAISIAQQGIGLGALYTSQNVGWKATNNLRKDLVLHCLGLDMEFHKLRTPGELIERIDGDVTELANFFSNFVVQVLAHVLLVLGILVMLYRENLWVGLILTVYVMAVLAMLGSLQGLASARWAAGRQASAEQYGYLEERISGADEIRASGAENYVLQRLYELMRKVLHTHRGAWLVAALTYNATSLLFVIGYATGLGLGVYLFLQGQATIGAAYLIVAYVGMLAEPLQQIRSQIQDFQRASASIQRVQELLHLQPRTAEPGLEERLSTATDTEGRPGVLVEFIGVSFAYENKSHVLNEVSFSLQPGRVLGVLGRTGSGKTTLTRLLFRLYDPDEGKILINGCDLRTLAMEKLRSQVGIVTQDVQLFQASLRDNLAFFDKRITDQDIHRALEKLHLREWVKNLPQGLDTLLIGGGQGFSGGEGQLLAFTRVFLKEPGLVILDEASSRLDPVTESLLERAVDRLLYGRTALIIAHRLATIQRADDILILENGRVVEYGARADLAADASSRFARLLQTGLQEALE
jgi:ATP-binding cassette, subfamily B, bacterial